ncbi:uncharacterized protein BT62DRAFT_1012598 [Guyanagaster necrorhizus]|uniref:Uncharacterized protein n=1 Tax=Guyanagaster necrorhizus TaxID=856835 RepID=A0A9P7VIE5_9AGAR|nr:uncharacterized protein BT62DRAFT_1012598 [Guyanagaster necrorhizus MCA 3950]KAG7440519.1 hypothetical protein BT62DRAFT_1012598 [Guyanagaster necrorhizus MCA 3950]
MARIMVKRVKYVNGIPCANLDELLAIFEKDKRLPSVMCGSGGEEDLQPEIVEEDEEIEVESEEEDIRAVEPPAPATPLLSNRRIISPEPDSFDIPSSLLVRGGDKSSSRALQNSLPHSKDAYISAQKLPLRIFLHVNVSMAFASNPPFVFHPPAFPYNANPSPYTLLCLRCLAQPALEDSSRVYRADMDSSRSLHWNL